MMNWPDIFESLRAALADVAIVLLIALAVSIAVIVASVPSLPQSGTGLNPCGTTPHCPTWNDNN